MSKLLHRSEASQILLQLSLVDGVGSGTLQFLIDRLGVEGLVNLPKMQVADFGKFGFSVNRAAALVAGLCNLAALDHELELMQRYGVQWASVLDPSYPQRLLQISNPPTILYWRGSLPNDSDLALAVVGSRAANHYGQRVINEIVPALVQAGAVIISGGALGADAMAHRAALAAGGKTVVVCGVGLQHYYPKLHQRLFEEILAKGGALISSFSMELEAIPGHFPARNRIIAGLSQGCLVVQAAAQSGAKITAMHALEQGREVFVVPGLFGDALSAGCHNLAQQGAKLVHSVADILAELPGFVIDKQLELEEPETDLNRLVIRLCGRPLTFGELQAQLPPVAAPELQTRLFELQLQGRVCQNFAGLWVQGSS